MKKLGKNQQKCREPEKRVKNFGKPVRNRQKYRKSSKM